MFLGEQVQSEKRILTAESSPAALQFGGWRVYIMRLHRQQFDRLPNLDPLQARGETLAYVNHGRWMCNCPHCGAASWAPETMPLCCVECGMKANGLRPCRVRFPENRWGIELVLKRRPEIETRNWTPGESLRDLLSENLKRGV